MSLLHLPTHKSLHPPSIQFTHLSFTPAVHSVTPPPTATNPSIPPSTIISNSVIHHSLQPSIPSPLHLQPPIPPSTIYPAHLLINHLVRPSILSPLHLQSPIPPSLHPPLYPTQLFIIHSSRPFRHPSTYSHQSLHPPSILLTHSSII